MITEDIRDLGSHLDRDLSFAEIGAAARKAAQTIALAPTEQKNEALLAAAAALRDQRDRVL
ncbi:MAG: hypothetical protein AAFO62_06180, partial [Pseudomonadota bacterium]